MKENKQFFLDHQKIILMTAFLKDKIRYSKDRQKLDNDNASIDLEYSTNKNNYNF